MLRFLFWFPLAAGSALIAWTSLPYFLFDPHHPFLLEHWSISGNAVWRGVLYAHVATGVVCLLSALPQFHPRLLAAWPRAHRVSGRAFGLAVLLVVVPTGLCLAFTAKGGFWSRTGFMVQGLLLFWTTWSGVRAATRGRFAAHRVWMTRAYAVAAAAITFRALFMGMLALGMETNAAYVASVWISFGFNFGVGELFVARMPAPRARRRLSTATLINKTTHV